MSVLKALRQRLAPELNFLFTIPPVETPVGWDCGWRGHEHAYHTFLVARMFGSPAGLYTGDYAVLSRFLPALTTLEREAKHAWCTVGELAPIDLSITFAWFAEAPQLRTAITGEGPNGDWEVRYAQDESILDENFQNGNEILLIERHAVAASALELLEDPGRFLPAPPPAARDNWVALHGPDIHAKIALHCHRYASGAGKSVRQKSTREEAIAWIAANYPEPLSEIRRLLPA